MVSHSSKVFRTRQNLKNVCCLDLIVHDFVLYLLESIDEDMVESIELFGEQYRILDLLLLHFVLILQVLRLDLYPLDLPRLNNIPTATLQHHGILLIHLLTFFNLHLFPCDLLYILRYIRLNTINSCEMHRVSHRERIS